MTSLRCLTAALALLSLTALADKKEPPKQNHQCMKDGQVLEKTHKECTKAGGTWQKMDTAKAADAKPADAKPADAKPADAKPADAKADPAPAPAPTK